MCSGTSTFIRACRHLTNFTVGCSAAIPLIGEPQFQYPDNHIEVDPRLVWFLGPLMRRYPDAVYVHLRRREEDVIASLMNFPIRSSQEPLLKALQGMLPPDASTELRRSVLQMYVNSVNASAETFLRTRSSMNLWLHGMRESFPVFLDYIGAQGDISAAVAEWREHDAPND